ncbi:MAG: hypothetical protein M3Y09_16410 [Actinomycetota bacterium]|nr:hypothetical protein [Actinomycetota bacterium]
MTSTRQTNDELASLIDEITVDCHDEDEQLTAFENAFYDAHLPCPGTLIGESIEVLSVGIATGRRELIATCRHNEHRYDIALLDITLDADPATSRLLAAYRRWTSTF